MEAVSRSPIYSSFAEMLQGIINIRAFQRTEDFRAQHFTKVDSNTSLLLLFWLTARWLAMRLDMLATGILLILSALAVFLCETGNYNAVSPSLLGLGLIYSLQLTGLLQWTIRLIVEMEVRHRHLPIRMPSGGTRYRPTFNLSLRTYLEPKPAYPPLPDAHRIT